nr:class I SAM-dependent methyltransferase [Allobranchiibius sp. GilTou38]
MSAAEWDERYAGSDLVWGGGPNIWVERVTTDLPAGRVPDLACGEGRNSVWLAARGWRVTGVDFSAEAIRKAQALSDAGPGRVGHADHVAQCGRDRTEPARLFRPGDDDLPAAA